MLPPATATELGRLGHDAVTVVGVELAGAADEVVYASAVGAGRTVVTENVADFAVLLEARLAREEPCVPVVLVRKRDFPRGGGLAAHLARHLDAWATEHPHPYPGLHWP